MQCWIRFFLFALFLLSGARGWAQGPSIRALDPRSFSGAGSGWSVIPSNGGLSVNVPLATVPGEIPIPLRLHLWGSPSIQQNVVPNPEVTNTLWERGVTGRVVFDPGNIDLNNLASADLINYTPPGGGALTAPAKFGLGSKTWAQVQSHTSGNFIYYSATVADLGTWGAKATSLAPQGFTHLSVKYEIIIGKDTAQIYLRGGIGYDTFAIPILWLDRFGHFVTFQWKMGHSADDHYVFSVTAMNQRGLGAQAQWGRLGVPAAVTTVPSTFFRADFIGYQSPSIQIDGFQGDVSDKDNMGLSGTSHYHGNSDCGTPAFRPTQILVDNPSNLPTPEWTSVGLAIPGSIGNAPWAEGLKWTFTYSPNLAEVTSFTDPLGVTTAFTYVTKCFYAGPNVDQGCWRWTNRLVSTANSFDSVTGVSLNRTWRHEVPGYEIYNYPVHWTSYKWVTSLTEQYSSGDPTEVVTQEWTFAGPDQPVHYLNGALLSQRNFSASKTWKKTDYILGSSGIDGTLSVYTGVTSAVDGNPVTATTTTWDPTGQLPLTETLKIGGVEWQSRTYTYDTDMGLLNPGRPATVNTKRLVGAALVSCPLQVFGYDSNGMLIVNQINSNSSFRSTNQYFDEEGHLRALGKMGRDGDTHIYSSYTSIALGTNGLPTSSTTSFNAPMGGVCSYSEAWTYSPEGWVLEGTDGRGVITTNTYDSRGRALTVKTSGSPTYTYSYPTERVTNCSIEDGRTSIVTVDGFGRVVSKQRTDGITETFSYDVLGRPTQFREINNKKATRIEYRSYDPLGRLRSASTFKSPLSQTLAYTIDGSSSKVTTTLSNGVASSSWTDPLGRVVKTVNSRSTVVTIYNAMNQPLRMDQTASGKVQTRTFTYDDLGNLTSRIEPETGTVTYGDFDALGNARRITDGARTRILAYDGLGRLRSASGGGDSVRQTYDGLFHVSSWSMSNGVPISVAYGYTPGSEGAQLASEIHDLPGTRWTSRYTYDVYGRLQTLTYPSGNVAGYIYDEKSRVKALTVGGVVKGTLGYDDWGHRNSLTFGSGAKDSWDWDPLGARPSNWSITPVTDSVATMAFGYDPNGNLSQGYGWSNLAHDQSGRLLSASGFSISQNLTYDGFDNNISNSSSQTPVGWNNFTFNPLGDNRIPSKTANGAGTGWAINGHGEAYQIGTMVGSNSILNLGWDGLGRLSSTTSASLSLNLAYVYGPTGLRFSTTDGFQPARSRAYAYNSKGMLLGEYKPSYGRSVSKAVPTAPSGIVALSTKTQARIATLPPIDGDGCVTRVIITQPQGGIAVPVGHLVTFRGVAKPGLISPDLSASNTRTEASPNFVGGSLYWDFGDGATARGNSVTHTYTQPGTYWVFATGISGSCQEGESGLQVIVTAPTPVVNSFTGTPGNLASPGQSCTLSWDVSNATQVTINDQVVSGSSLVVNPLTSTTYDLWASNSGGGVGTTLRITVAEPTYIWNRDVFYLGPDAVLELDVNGFHELHNDIQGTPRVITSGATGRVEGSQAFGPFGEVLPSPATNGYAPLIGFAGHVFQDVSGLIYMKSRFYSPTWHRFINSDQGLDPDTLNQYAYVGGSPFTRVDPSGLLSWGDWNFFWRSFGYVVKKIGKFLGDVATAGFKNGGAAVGPMQQTLDYYHQASRAQFASSGDGEPTLVPVEGVVEYRKNISLTGDDKYGHWWTELSDEESYGWWPEDQPSAWGTLTGVDGVLNGQGTFGGTSTRDPHQGDRAKSVVAYQVYASSGYTAEQVKQMIRDYANSYSGSWSWPFGKNCHSFQKNMNRTLGFTVVKIPKP